ncbi:CBO0543 family protein [Halobacillus massiliensis]|uniref:CBO0543 family protein n=1 Tax=Halobacillus massiliensis TaxID=1926286 RepID=UPI003CCBE7DF
MLPVFDIKSLSTLPFILGLYPVFSSYMIFFIKEYKKTWYWILLFSFGTTFLELLLLLYGRVIYGNGWNIFFTFISYLIPYYVTYLFYKLVKTYKFRKHNT